MPAKRAFEDQITSLDALRGIASEERIEPLRKALKHRNNFVAGKAADMVREFAIAPLIPDLLVAFHRFFENPEKSDPQCWAKNALSRALAGLEHQEPDCFLQGMHHIQMEPVWGGRSDTAGTLRATCALALVQCAGLREEILLAHLINLLADKDKNVRTEVVHAIENVGSTSAALVLRTRATMGTDEPEVLGACYGGVLRIEGTSAISWIARFLDAADESAGEAALAIAGTRSLAAFECLRDRLSNAIDPWWRSVLLSAIGLTRQDAATEFLLDLIATESLDAERAIEAVMRLRPSAQLAQRLDTIVSANPRLARHLAEQRRE